MIHVDYLNEPKVFQPEEISAMILTKMKETAESYLGNDVTQLLQFQHTLMMPKDRQQRMQELLQVLKFSGLLMNQQQQLYLMVLIRNLETEHSYC